MGPKTEGGRLAAPYPHRSRRELAWPSVGAARDPRGRTHVGGKWRRRRDDSLLSAGTRNTDAGRWPRRWKVVGETPLSLLRGHT